MPAIMKLSVTEAADLADQIEEGGGNASSLRDTISDVTRKSLGLKTIAVNEVLDEEYIEAVRKQSTIEHGTDLECMICHDKFDHLISGTCEVCWREWVLSIKGKG